MKVVLYSIVLVLLNFLFLSCNDNSSSPVDSTHYFTVQGTVFDVVNSDYSPELKKGVIVHLDNESTISNDEGKYSFYRISKGEHIIRVSLTNCEPFSKTFSVNKDTTIDIYLYGIKEDYFPIDMNYQKVFKYYSGVSTPVYSWSDNGEAEWIISSFKEEEKSYVYEVKETKIFTHKTFAPLTSERIDTTVSKFYITVDSSNKIYFISSILDGASFYRKQDPRLEQNGVLTINLNNGSFTAFTLALIKNSGISKIDNVVKGFSTTYELIK